MERAQRQFCLDMMKVNWVGSDGSEKHDCAILLEIEPVGGLIQTTVPITRSSMIILDTGRGFVPAHVTSCDKDDYGYIVNFAINDTAANWFPEYVPNFLHSAGGR